MGMYLLCAVGSFAICAAPTFLQRPVLPKSLECLDTRRRGATGCGIPRAHASSASSSPCSGASFALAAVGSLLGAAAAAAHSRGGAQSRKEASVVACRAINPTGSPQKIPVVDLEGKQIGEETLDLVTLSKDTANYVVHHAITVWMYQQKPFTNYAKRRSDVKKGRKPWKQKGSGRARHGSKYSPLFGRSSTNQAPHGLDNKRNKKLPRIYHCRCISTVLQSKWRCMKIVVGLEDWKEPRQNELEKVIKSVTKTNIGAKSMLMITRSGYGEIHKIRCQPTPESYERPLYMSGRLIPRLVMRRPRDIDPAGDGLFQCLKARRLIISREAFFDLLAKFSNESGWAFKSERTILIEALKDIIDEFPNDRRKEIEVARMLPRSIPKREKWAIQQREKMALEEAA